MFLKPELRRSVSQQFEVHANQIKQYKDQLLERATGVFGDDAKAEPATPALCL